MTQSGLTVYCCKPLFYLLCNYTMLYSSKTELYSTSLSFFLHIKVLYLIIKGTLTNAFMA